MKFGKPLISAEQKGFFLRPMQWRGYNQTHGKVIKVLHFFPANEQKFEAQARRFFQRKYLDNSWIYWSEHEKKHVDQREAKRIAENYDWVIFHSAPFKLARTIKKISKNSRTIVQFWGGDYSAVLTPQSKLYLPRTKQEFWREWKKENLSISFIRYRWYLAKGAFRRSRYLDALSLCHHLCFLAGESELKGLPSHLKAKCATWHVNYSSGNEMDWSVPFSSDYDSSNILVGNSATLTNNHVDIIELLSKMPNNLNQIFLPLSYGITEVQKRVNTIAAKKLGERARPLINFMPRKDYYELLDSVGFVIMGHLRQQALGNLQWAFFTKRTVYLWQDSVLFEHFSKMDFVIRSIDSIEELGLIGLNAEEAEKNKLLVSRLLLNDAGQELELCLQTAH
jgi:hypothetical protein